MIDNRSKEEYEDDASVWTYSKKPIQFFVAHIPNVLPHSSMCEHCNPAAHPAHRAQLYPHCWLE